jgi:hypothetical protein
VEKPYSLRPTHTRSDSLTRRVPSSPVLAVSGGEGVSVQ